MCRTRWTSLPRCARADDLSTLPVGRRVMVIGGGMTAVDAAVQTKLLGAKEVHMVYRRGPEHMSASKAEQEWAQTNGVVLHHWLAPGGDHRRNDGHASARALCRAKPGGRQAAAPPGARSPGKPTWCSRPSARQLGNPVLAQSRLRRCRTAALPPTPTGQTNLPGVWAGGDCRAGGLDLTVEAVEHGKQSAHAIHAQLTGA